MLYVKLFEEDPEEENRILRPAKSPHHQIGGRTRQRGRRKAE